MGSVYRCLCSRPVFMVYVLTPVNTDREHIMVRYKFIDWLTEVKSSLNSHLILESLSLSTYDIATEHINAVTTLY